MFIDVRLIYLVLLKFLLTLSGQIYPVNSVRNWSFVCESLKLCVCECVCVCVSVCVWMCLSEFSNVFVCRYCARGHQREIFSFWNLMLDWKTIEFLEQRHLLHISAIIKVVILSFSAKENVVGWTEHISVIKFCDKKFSNQQKNEKKFNWKIK